MPPVSPSKSFRALLAGGALALCVTSAALAQDLPAAPSSEEPPAAEAVAAPTGVAAEPAAAERGAGAPAPARLRLQLRDVESRKVDVGKRFGVVGRIYPFVPRQGVGVRLKQNHQIIQRRHLKITRIPGTDAGRFALTSKRIIEPGTYRFFVKKSRTVAQAGAQGHTRGVEVDYPDLDPGDRGADVRLFNKLLDARAYRTARGERYGSATERAVLAYRKVNNMARVTNATPDIFKTLAAGRGGFRLKWPEGGKHIETDLSRQVMVLARGGKARQIFHISSGAPATPTVRGKYATYRKDYGMNSKGMLHSVYFHRGYATHGYHSVPTYPASHGCLRNPFPDSKFIYDWIDIGDVFYVYG